MSAQPGSADANGRALLEAVGQLGADLELDRVLDRLIREARRLVGARYGAVAVLGPDGMLNELFAQGPDGRTVRSIDPPPAGPHVLQVPIPGPRQTFGHLYVTDKLAGAITDTDVDIVTALASAAGVAVENARRYEQSAKRQRWLEALAEVQEVLLTSTDRTAALRLIATRAREVAGADFAAILLPAQDDELVIEVVSGDGLDGRHGVRYPVAGSLTGEVLRTGRSVVVDDLPEDEHFFSHAGGWPQGWPELGSALFVPLSTTAGPLGVLVVASHRGEDCGFALTTVHLVGSLAGQAALALERLRAREDRARLAVFEDRDRIARDLHDHVIQQLFATGLQLQGAARRSTDQELRDRLERAVDDLDATIASIRASIYQLNQRSDSLSGEVADLIEAASRSLGFRPSLVVGGPLDQGVPGRVRPHLLAVLREALANVARHARADRVDVAVEVGDQIAVVVEDDGVGVGSTTRRSGLRNLRERAESLGGELLVGPRPDTGTRLLWRVPLRA